MFDVADVAEAQNRWDMLLRLDPARLPEAAAGTCEGFCDAFEILTENLRGLGYPLETFWTPCSDGLPARLREIQNLLGLEIPRCLGYLWGEIGGFSLVDLDRYKHVE